MVPLSSVLRSKWVVAPPSQCSASMVSPAIKIIGGPKLDGPQFGRGHGRRCSASSREDLPPGFGYDWAGQSSRSSSRAPKRRCCLALSIFVVFLCLAALYESWATPIAVLLVVPVGIIGAIVAAKADGPAQRRVLQGRPHHHHRPCRQERHPDRRVRACEAAASAARRCMKPSMEAARLRLRPILMTSFAFILGVLPLVFATRRRRQCAPRHRHGRGRRHVVGRDPRRAAGAGLLRDHPAHGGEKLAC